MLTAKSFLDSDGKEAHRRSKDTFIVDLVLVEGKRGGPQDHYRLSPSAPLICSLTKYLIDHPQSPVSPSPRSDGTILGFYRFLSELEQAQSARHHLFSGGKKQDLALVMKLLFSSKHVTAHSLHHNS